MNDNSLQDYLDFAKDLGHEAGKIMLKYFRADDLGTVWKDDNSPVTAADLTINKLVIDRVKATYPSHGVLGEEERYEDTRSHLWIVDPVDGTTPYDLGMPIATSCLAYVVDGEVQVSVVFDPFQDDMYWAAKGQGAFLNGKKMEIPQTDSFEHSYVFCPTVSTNNEVDFNPVANALRPKGAKMLSISSYSYIAALILKGKMRVALMSYGSQWDAAAISLIIEEAGGRATDLDGKIRKYNEWGNGIVLSNGILHDEIIGMING